MNNRRKLLAVLGAATFTPQLVFAQSRQPILIGWLSVHSREAVAQRFAAFKEGRAFPLTLRFHLLKRGWIAPGLSRFWLSSNNSPNSNRGANIFAIISREMEAAM